MLAPFESTRSKFDLGKVEAIFSNLAQSHFPGAAVGIAINGRPVYRKGFGLASAELPVVLSPTIRMRIGSITKHFTSLAYLLLCEDGKAHIDQNLGTLFPELHPVIHGVTMRQIMGHLSGMRDVFDICWHFSGVGHPVSSSDLLSLYTTIDDINAAPGDSWIYNNGAYLILSAAIERITDSTLEDVLAERIFNRVGMRDTLLRRVDTDFVSNSATLHTPNSRGEFSKLYMGTSLAGEGGLVSTVNDMLTWLSHMDVPMIGTDQTWKMLTTAQTLHNGISTNYGFGLMLENYKGVKLLRHSGGLLGGNADMVKVVAGGFDMVILVNRGDVWATTLANQVLDSCLLGLQPAGISREAAPITGRFRSSTSGRVIQLLGRDRQQFAIIDGVEIPVDFEKNNVLRPAQIWSFLKQKVVLVGNPTNPESLVLDEFGNRDPMLPLETDIRPSASRIEGTFYSRSTRSQVSINADSSGASMRSRGLFGVETYNLECLGRGIWRASAEGPLPRGGILSFQEDGDYFSFTAPRTRDLVFRRS
jgi:CubicO group peptidase (beta-lactamase class C family)